MFWKEIKENIRENFFEHKKKKQGLKFNPGLALIARVSAIRKFFSYLPCLSSISSLFEATIFMIHLTRVATVLDD